MVWQQFSSNSFFKAIHQYEDQTVIIQDGRSQTVAQLHTQAKGLSDQLLSIGALRVALTTHRADVLLIALLACQISRSDLLMLHRNYEETDSIWGEWQVDTTINDDLVVRPLSLGEVASGKSEIILTTTGTTGVAKAVRHSLVTLLGRVRPPIQTNTTPQWLLTYHPASFAGLQVLLTTVLGGNHLIALSDANVSHLADAALHYRPTHISATPTFWRAFLATIRGQEERIPLMQITLGGEAVDQTTLARLKNAFPTARISHIYASTETGVLFTVTDGREGFPASWLETGVKKENVKLRIRENVLEVLSPRVMKGYMKDQTIQTMTEDGWIRTGDLVRVEGDRVLFMGRVDCIINVGGEKVGPEEVEAVLLMLPVVREVRVFGIPNPLTGALVAAEVVTESEMNESEVREMIIRHASKYLEKYKVPHILQFVNEITPNIAGKKIRT